MSLVSFIGPRPNLLGIDETEPPMRLEAQQPILTAEDMEKIRHIELFTGGAFRSVELDICYPAAWGANGMEAALASAVRPRRGRDPRGLQHPHPLRPQRVAASCCRSRRCSPPRPCTSIWCARACARAPAWSSRPARRAKCIISRCSPATAPRRSIRISRSRRSPSCSESCRRFDAKESAQALHQGDLQGALKVMSKMGISTYQSYCGAQIFEAVGLQKRVRRQVFHRHREQRRGHRPVRGRRGSGAPAPARVRRRPLLRDALDAGGEYAYRVRGEEHMWTPDSIAKLQHATRANSYATYREYAAAHQRPDAAA